VEVEASLSQGRTAAAQCGLFTHKSVPVIFEPPCSMWFILFSIDKMCRLHSLSCIKLHLLASIFICRFVKCMKCKAMLQIEMKRKVDQLTSVNIPWYT